MKTLVIDCPRHGPKSEGAYDGTDIGFLSDPKVICVACLREFLDYANGKMEELPEDNFYYDPLVCK